MSTERLPLPLGEMLERIQKGELVAVLRSLFEALSHRPPPEDTSIAWEDGEVEEEEGREARR